MNSALLFLTLFSIIIGILPEDQFTDHYGDYLGSTPPGAEPQVFAPDIISKKSLEHSAAVFSKDGNEVYWISIEQPISENSKTLWFMKRVDNRWSAPKIFKLPQRASPDNPFLSHDNQGLFFDYQNLPQSSNIETTDPWVKNRNNDIFYVQRSDTTWGSPIRLNDNVNNEVYQGQATFTKNGTIYYMSYLEGVQEGFGIYRSKYVNGKYLKPELLPEIINSPAIDWTPFIAPDESYLIFSSNRHDSTDTGDLFISFHDTITDVWADPVNMGPLINTKAQERFPAVSPDGKYLFYTSWNGENHMDIFWVSTNIINRLKSLSQ